MGKFSGHNIVRGVSGSIAAYKSAYLLRLLIKSGNNVKVIMTEAATKFVSPLTFSTLSQEQVYKDFFEEGIWNNHVDLGIWADILVIAPCTATTLSKMTNGHADNILVGTYLSAKCPVAIAPAMDLDMWKHQSTVDNLQKLIDHGCHIIDVEHGFLASGLVGNGRMAEPENIVEAVDKIINPNLDLSKKNVLITAGPTIESIDPVRFISNHSSGKMGLALAHECEKRGANVFLVIGPNHLNPLLKKGEVIEVKSADNMFEACQRLHKKMDACIFAAAVADYKPKKYATNKIKKEGAGINVELERTPDIAKSLGIDKSINQIHIGFALETKDEMKNAVGKVTSKNFDAIVLNSLNDKGAGFGHDTNKVKIINAESHVIDIPLKTKKEVSIDIIDELVRLIGSKSKL